MHPLGHAPRYDCTVLPVCVCGIYRTTLIGMVVIGVGATMAFLFNIAGYYFTLYTSALTSTVGANGVKIILITAAAIQAGVSDAISWIGISITVVTICAYSYFNITEQQQQQQHQQQQRVDPGACSQRMLPSAAGSAALAALAPSVAPASEKTPLVSKGATSERGPASDAGYVENKV